jgi:hypothetical protein
MLQLNTSAKQKQFEAQAAKRYEHHAPNIEDIAPIVIRAVFAYADAGSVNGNLYRGRLTGSGWADFGGRRYWGGYNRSTKQIEFREDSLQGRPVLSFDNSSRKAEVERQIRRLRQLSA